MQPRHWEPAYYLKDDGVGVTYVQPGEYSLGYATVKIELNFPTPTPTAYTTSLVTDEVSLVTDDALLAQ